MKRLPLMMVVMLAVGLLAPASMASAAPVYCKVRATLVVRQVIWVDGSGSRQTTRLCAYVSPGRYVMQKGPYFGHVGRNGVAAVGAKREGDGKTPHGAYEMRGRFWGLWQPGAGVVLAGDELA